MALEQAGQTIEQLSASGWKEAPHPTAAPAPAGNGDPAAFAPVRAALDAYDAKFRPTTAGKVDTWMNTPLGHPTGNDTIDEMTSPSNLAMIGLVGAKPATHLALKAIGGLMGAVSSEVAADIVGLMSPRAAHALRITQRIASRAAAAAQTPAPTTGQAPPAPEAAAPGTTPAAAAPSQAVPAPPSQPASSAAAPGAPATSPSVPEIPQPYLKMAAVLKQAGYSQPEIALAAKLHAQGMSLEQMVAHLDAARELMKTGPFANLPTDLEVAKKVASAAHTGKF